ncbi:YxeA family protein [Alkalihalobacillus sp. NPDC078783]
MRKVLITALILIIAVASVYLVFRETFDRFNPLISKEYVYVEIQEAPADDNGRYKYHLQGVNEEGETKRVVFSTSAILDHGTFVKVLAKGSYTEEYELIDKESMP